MVFLSSWNKEKNVTEIVLSDMYATDQAAPDKLIIPLDKLPW